MWLNKSNSLHTPHTNVRWITIFIYYSRLVPDAVDTVICAPDDGWRDHPKHVEQFTDKINCVHLHLVGHLLIFESLVSFYPISALIIIKLNLSLPLVKQRAVTAHVGGQADTAAHFQNLSITTSMSVISFTLWSL